MNIFAVDPLSYVYATTALVAILTIVVLLHKDKFSDKESWAFFLLISLPVILTTLYLAGHTIHENTISATGGPVHWHADYQVWTCGERLDLVDPQFPKNKIGSPLFHEHNDDRIHVEGTVMHLADVDLGSYFEVIGGRLTSSSLVYRDQDELVQVNNGDLCNGEESTLKVYLNGERIEDPTNYLYYPDAYVPPGDCIIIEFGPGQEATTSKLCESWQAQGWNYDNYEENRGDGNGN